MHPPAAASPTAAQISAATASAGLPCTCTLVTFAAAGLAGSTPLATAIAMPSASLLASSSSRTRMASISFLASAAKRGSASKTESTASVEVSSARARRGRERGVEAPSDQLLLAAVRTVECESTLTPSALDESAALIEEEPPLLFAAFFAPSFLHGALREEDEAALGLVALHRRQLLGQRGEELRVALRAVETVRLARRRDRQRDRHE
mmetsp:Transcript_8866/g.19632  ORF Transcript_8866/g.19632 Transcript_8866/m.19632 type:complete len:208 (+) Transcript_8866:1157-1780(+)